MRPFIRHGMCCLLALLIPSDPMIFQYLSTPDVRAAQEAQRDSGAGKKSNDPSPKDLKRMADEMGHYLDALEAVVKEIPRDTFDPQAIVTKVGRDPEKLFAWVRDNTYWVPYQGSLRGPTGVLMDRLGSSLDRALLLAELLRLSGQNVRLAHAQLPEEKAKQILEKVQPVPDSPLPSPSPASGKHINDLITKFAKQFDLDSSAMRKNAQEATWRGDKLAEEVTQRVKEQTPVIAKAIGQPLEKDTAALRVRESADRLAAFRDHWWVQSREGNVWKDWDLLLPAVNSALVAVQSTIDPSQKDGLFHLDSKLCHEVVIRIIIQQWQKEGAKEKTALTHTLRPSDLFGTRIAVNHFPIRWPKDLDLLKEKNALDKFRSTALAQDEWLPVLTVGSKRVFQSSFTDSGDLIATPLAPLLGGGAQKLGGTIGGILGGGKIGQAPGRQPKAGTQLTAEWIEYEIHVPGQAIRKIRRQVFDLGVSMAQPDKKKSEFAITQNQRVERGFALLGDLEVLIQPCHLSADYITYQWARAILSNRDIFVEIVSRSTWNQKTLNEMLAKFTPITTQLYDLALLRQRLSPFKSHIYLDRPNILGFWTYFDQTTKEPRLCKAIDIVENDLAVLPKSKSQAFLVRLHQGVLETNTEAFLLKGCGYVESTAEIFPAGDGDNNGWLTIRNSRQLRENSAKVAPEIRAGVSQDLQDGYVVLIPQKKTGRTWWRVNPKTGQTLGVGSRGWGQSATELMVLRVAVMGFVVFLGCISASGVHRSDLSPEKNNKVALICFATALSLALLTFAGTSSMTEMQFGAGVIGAGIGGVLAGLSL